MADPVEQNILGVQQLVGSKLNKTMMSPENLEGPTGEAEDVLTLKLTDEELIDLANDWTTRYAGYESKINVRQEKNKQFYLGLQKEGSSSVVTDAISANILFEAEETFLPAALSKNPEPVVWSDNTEEGDKQAKAVKTMLQYHADVLGFRQKLKMMTRQNSIYLIGVMKHGWDEKVKDITSELRKPQNFIFDPNGFVNAQADYEGPLGERVEVTAQKLCDLFPKHSAYVTIMVDGKMGTKVTYTEWWTDEYCFYTFKGKVLDKHKNQYFNYDEDETSEEDIDGNTETITKEGKNHFARPKKPYTFLSIFSLEEQPHDITSLIEQNIPNQRRVTRRTEQIDYNLTKSNNSDVYSENNFTQETAKQAATAIAKGNPVIVPKGGPIGEAIHRLNAPGMDAAFFKDLEVSKQDLRQIFGTQGITTNPQDEDKTVRGKILNQRNDTTRIGGGIGDALEMVADNVFNWWTQLYYVFYDEPHYASIMGQMKASEYEIVHNQNLSVRLVVSVSPDSMKPKDETTEMNQALSLFEAGALDPKSLLTILDLPDPQKLAENAVLWQVDKAAYIKINFPELTQQLAQLADQMQMQQMQSGGGAPGDIIKPEGIFEPPKGIEAPASGAELSQVPINNVAVPK
jgi:hypothetical protein